MKRLCLILAFLFLFTQTASAMPLLIGQKVVYRGTVTGLRISAVDGTAFIDNLPYTYQSDFSAGVDGWTAGRGTVAGNIDSIGGEDDWLRFTVDTQNNTHHAAKTSQFTVGRKYTVTMKYYIPSGQTTVAGLILTNGGRFLTGVTYQSTLDTVVTYTATFTALDTSLNIYATTSVGIVTINDAGGDDVFYIKDVTISEITPYMDGNHQIEIYDSSNKMLRGVLKAAGTSETVDAEEIENNDFSGTWTGNIPQSWVVAGTVDANNYVVGDDVNNRVQIVNTTGYVGIKQTGTITFVQVGGLYKIVCTVFNTTSGNIQVGLGGAAVTINSTSTFYNNVNVSPDFFLQRSGNNCNITVSSVSMKKVLTPSSTGCIIVSSKAGTTYNFSYKNASFTYNAASYYVIIRAIR